MCEDIYNLLLKIYNYLGDDYMKILKNNLKSELNIRTEMNFPIDGIEFIDINPMLIDKEIYNEVIEKFISEIQNKNIDYIISPEARGFLFGCPVANKLNIGFIPVRKKGKMPPTTVEKAFEYEKEYGKDILELPKLLNNESYIDKNFYIIDDIYATGNTARAIKETVESLGGKVLGTGVVINIKELNNDDAFSLIDINEK